MPTTIFDIPADVLGLLSLYVYKEYVYLSMTCKDAVRLLNKAIRLKAFETMPRGTGALKYLVLLKDKILPDDVFPQGLKTLDITSVYSDCIIDILPAGLESFTFRKLIASEPLDMADMRNLHEALALNCSRLPRSLKKLILVGCVFNDFKALPDLMELSTNTSCHFDEATVSLLPDTLTALELRGSYTWSGPEVFNLLPRGLKTLRITFNAHMDAGIKNLPNLTTLDINRFMRSILRDSCFADLPRSLTSLQMIDCNIVNPENVSKLPMLRDLFIRVGRIPGDCLHALPRSLVNLEYHDGSFTEANIADLPRGLESFVVMNDDCVLEGSWMDKLPKNLNALRTNVRGAFDAWPENLVSLTTNTFDEASVKALPTTLKNLTISGDDIEPAGSLLGLLPDIEHFSMVGFNNLTLDDICLLPASCRSILLVTQGNVTAADILAARPFMEQKFVQVINMDSDDAFTVEL